MFLNAAILILCMAMYNYFVVMTFIYKKNHDLKSYRYMFLLLYRSTVFDCVCIVSMVLFCRDDIYIYIHKKIALGSVLSNVKLSSSFHY